MPEKSTRSRDLIRAEVRLLFRATNSASPRRNRAQTPCRRIFATGEDGAAEVGVAGDFMRLKAGPPSRVHEARLFAKKPSRPVRPQSNRPSSFGPETEKLVFATFTLEKSTPCLFGKRLDPVEGRRHLSADEAGWPLKQGAA